MVAIPLLFGRLTAADYEDAVASDRRASTRSAPESNASKSRASPPTTTIPTSAPSPTHFAWNSNDGTVLEETVEYPIGHRRRREEGMPLLVEKFKTNLRRRFPEAQQQRILEVSLDRERLEAMPVNEYVDLYVPRDGTALCAEMRIGRKIEAIWDKLCIWKLWLQVLTDSLHSVSQLHSSSKGRRHAAMVTKAYEGSADEALHEAWRCQAYSDKATREW